MCFVAFTSHRPRRLCACATALTLTAGIAIAAVAADAEPRSRTFRFDYGATAVGLALGGDQLDVAHTLCDRVDAHMPYDKLKPGCGPGDVQ